LTVGFLLIILVGCSSHKKMQPKIEVKTESKNEPEETIKLKPGVPQKLQGQYYYSKLNDGQSYDDVFFTLEIMNDKLSLQKSDESSRDWDWMEVGSAEIDTQTYILSDNFRYIKVIRENEHQLSVTKDSFGEIDDAIAATEMQTYDKRKITGFGVAARDLYKKCYVSDTDFTKYFKFNNSPMNSNLIKVKIDGSPDYLQHYEIIHAKVGQYLLALGNNKGYLILDKLSPTQIRDTTTGETYSLYQGSDYALEKEILQRLGVTPPEIKYNPPAEVKPKKPAKIYDFADDQDDDYYDTYDDFDLNNGD